MNIVILDGHSVNPNDLSWKPLESHGDITVYPRTVPESIYERALNAEIVLTNKNKITAEVIESLPKLRYIGLLATGFDNVDRAAAKKRGITVSNIPAYGSPSVAQHTFALILELTNRVGLHNKSVQELEWVRSKDFSYFKSPLTELYAKTIGLIGYGNISKAVAKVAIGFGMNVLVHSKHAKSIEEGTLVSLDELAEKSDIISIHAGLTPENSCLINAEFINKMKSSAFIINTSRGGIINEADLANALNTEKIAAAGLDVLSVEPPKIENPLLTAKNCVITPHIAWVTIEARQRLILIAADNIKGFLEGKPKNVVA